MKKILLTTIVGCFVASNCGGMKVDDECAVTLYGDATKIAKLRNTDIIRKDEKGCFVFDISRLFFLIQTAPQELLTGSGSDVLVPHEEEETIVVSKRSFYTSRTRKRDVALTNASLLQIQLTDATIRPAVLKRAAKYEPLAEESDTKTPKSEGTHQANPQKKENPE